MLNLHFWLLTYYKMEEYIFVAVRSPGFILDLRCAICASDKRTKAFAGATGQHHHQPLWSPSLDIFARKKTSPDPHLKWLKWGMSHHWFHHGNSWSFDEFPLKGLFDYQWNRRRERWATVPWWDPVPRCPGEKFNMAIWMKDLHDSRSRKKSKNSNVEKTHF